MGAKRYVLDLNLPASLDKIQTNIDFQNWWLHIVKHDGLGYVKNKTNTWEILIGIVMISWIHEVRPQ